MLYFTDVHFISWVLFVFIYSLNFFLNSIGLYKALHRHMEFILDD